MSLGTLDIDDFVYRLAAAQARIDNLELALKSSRRIGCAIGILMALHRVPGEEAFAMLSSASQTLHRKLRDIAEEVVVTGEIPGTGVRLATPA